MLEFAFPEVTDGPPYPRIDKREHLLANVSVSAFRDGQICYASIERCVHAAVIEIVPGVLYRSLSRAALVDQRLQSGNGMLSLLVLGLAFVETGSGSLVLRQS